MIKPRQATREEIDAILISNPSDRSKALNDLMDEPLMTQAEDAAAYRECLKRAQANGFPAIGELIDDYERMKAG